ncbi:hypothetical protein ABPG74_022248 [Tetrahymena malaccensis]
MADHHDDDFVKNYEDQDSSGEFEAKVNETISAHMKQTVNRPVSKSGRPESSRYNALNWKNGNGNSNTNLKDQDFQDNNHEVAKNKEKEKEDNQNQQQSKNKQIYEALKKQSSQQLPNPVIQKMSKFIAFHHISLETFWKSSRIYVELDEFVEYCLDIGMSIQEWELETVQKELTDQDGYVTIKILCDKIQPWHNQENAMLEFIREKVLTMAQSSKKKFRVQSQKFARQQSAKNTISSQQQRPQSGISQDFQYNQYVFHENKSKVYLQKHKEKEKDQDKFLNITISKNKNEHEYEALIKMGEANEIQEELKTRINYRAYKNSDGHMLVHMYDGERFVTEMTLIEFRREHTSLKLAYNKSKNLKIWDVLSENKKAIKGRDFSKNVQKNEVQAPDQLEAVQGGQELAAGKKVKTTRQQELKKVLLETMWLSNILNEQSGILNKKGINVNNQLNKSYSALNVNRSMSASHQF